MIEPKFEVKRFEPTDPMGWEVPVKSEPFLIRETKQYLINIDGIGYRWDVAWLKEGKRHQSFVLFTPPFNEAEEYTQEQQLELREQARALLRAEVPGEGQQFRLKLPAGTWGSSYV